MKHLKKSLKIVSLLALFCSVSFVTGCAHHISSDVYSENALMGPSSAYRGVVISLRQVQVENSESPNDSCAGMFAGGVVGGVLGNQVGKGTGNVVATATGALLGALVGSSAEQSLSTQDAYEYVVQLDNGALQVVVQGMDSLLMPGQSVMMIVSQRGRARLIPDYTR